MKKIILATLIFGVATVSSAAEDTWTKKADMPIATSLHSASVVDNKIYIIGGTDDLFGWSDYWSTAWEYDPASDMWTRKADMPTGKARLSTSVVDGKIYAIGGSPHRDAEVSTVEVYDPATDTWMRVADMPRARNWHTSSVVNGKIYTIGGKIYPSETMVSTVEEYDPATDTWTRKTDMPTARGMHSASVVDGKIYVIGGVTGNFGPWVSTMEEYDPVTDTWTKKADMPTARTAHSSSALAGKVYVIGGANSWESCLSLLEMYDPATDTWAKGLDMPTARGCFSTSVVNGKIYGIGGTLNPSSWMPIATVEEYDPGLTVPSPDFNGDGIVDSTDMCIMVDHWGEDYSPCDIAPSPFGDGIIDVQDLIVLAEHLFEGAGLVAHWALDETEGDIAYDSAGNINATVYNGQWSAGKVDGALDFNGLTTYMDCGDSLRFGTQKMTLAMWLEPQHMGGMRYVFSRARERAEDFDYVLMRHYEGQVEFAVAQEGSEPVSVLSSGTTPLNEWTHVAVCLDGSEATIYINGQLDASAGYTQRSSREDCRFWISSLGKESRYYNGKIDDIKIYNVALSAGQIEDLAQ